MWRWAMIGAAATGLAACGGAGPSTNDATPGARAAGPDYVATIRAMSPEQRKATFLRAIRDARQPCQQVVAEQPAGETDGAASWTVRCEDRSGWLIAIAPDGNAKVTGPVPAR